MSSDRDISALVRLKSLLDRGEIDQPTFDKLSNVLVRSMSDSDHAIDNAHSNGALHGEQDSDHSDSLRPDHRTIQAQSRVSQPKSFVHGFYKFLCAIFLIQNFIILFIALMYAVFSLFDMMDILRLYDIVNYRYFGPFISWAIQSFVFMYVSIFATIVAIFFFKLSRRS